MAQTLDGMAAGIDTPPVDQAPRKRQMTDAQREALARGREAGRRTAADKAPKKPLGAKSAKARGLGRRITEGITFVAAIVSAKDQFDGMVLAAGAPRLGETYAAVLERHPKLLQMFGQLEAGGVYGAAAIATLAVVLPIAAHHQLLPPQLAPLAEMFTPTPVAAMAGAGQEAPNGHGPSPALV